MINEPIRFKIEDNKISLEDGYVGEMMELNEYPIEIGTNEYLDGCRAIVKKYGEQELEELGEFSCKLERLVVIKKDDEYWWGKLSYYKGEKDPLLHRASLFKYHPIEEQSEFPEIKKIIGYNVVEDENSYIEGTFTGNSNEEEYEFTFSKLKLGELEVNNSDSAQSNNITINCYTDFSLIPSPPKKQGAVEIPKAVVVEGTTSYGNELIDFKASLNFSFYNEEDGIYYYIKEFVNSDKPNQGEAQDVPSTETSGTETSGTETSGTETSGTETSGTETSGTETEYVIFSNDEESIFEGNIQIGFSETNFSDYNLKIFGIITQNIENETENETESEAIAQNIENGIENGTEDETETETEDETEESIKKETQISVYDIVSGVTIDLGEINFKEEEVSEEDISAEPLSAVYLNVYKTIISSNILTSKLPKFLLGVRKREETEGNYETKYITNGTEVIVTPSIESSIWETETNIDLTYFVGDYDEDSKSYVTWKYNDNGEIEITDIIENQSYDIYITKGTLEKDSEGVFTYTEAEEIKAYRWDLEVGFIELSKSNYN